MKNKFLIGTLTFFGTIILVLVVFNFFNSNSSKNYFFDRKINSENNLLKFERKFNKVNEDEYIMYVNSDNIIVESDKFSFEKTKTKYKLYFRDLKFENLKTEELILPSTANLLYCDYENAIFTNYLKVYKYDLKTKIITKININNFAVFTLKPLSKSKNEFICFANHFDGKEYKTGFFVVNFKTCEIINSKILNIESFQNVSENALKYSGKFTKQINENLIIYNCDKYSRLYFFDSEGNYVKEIQTNDKTPLPIIAKNKLGYSFYSRKGTWNTNMGCFMKDNKIFVFSASTKNINNLVIDQYDYSTLKYIQTNIIRYENQSSFDIRQVYSLGNELIVGFEFYYASFIF